MDAGVFGVECETDGRIAPVARKIGKKCPNSYKKRQKYAQKHFRNIKPDRLLGNAKSNRHRKTYPVEPGGTGRKYLFLLGETWRVRASQESAEAIVALMPGESGAERRAEESREDHSLHPFPAARRRATRVRSGNCGSSRTGGPSRAGGFLRRGGTCPSSRGGQRAQTSEEVQ